MSEEKSRLRRVLFAIVMGVALIVVMVGALSYFVSFQGCP
jgi:hypothetical protein